MCVPLFLVSFRASPALGRGTIFHSSRVEENVMGQDLWNMEFGQVGGFLKMLIKRGVSPEHLLRALKEEARMDVIAGVIRNLTAEITFGIVFDEKKMCHSLGLHPSIGLPVPEPIPGEIIAWYGGWSVADLNDKVSAYYPEQRWFENKPWFSERSEPGYYRLRIPVHGSLQKTFSEQEPLLLPGEEAMSLRIGVAVWNVHRSIYSQDLFEGYDVRCAECYEAHGEIHHVSLQVVGDRLIINCPSNGANVRTALAAVKKIS